MTFTVTDTAKSVAVRYEGVLPDLFKEGKGVVAQGQLGADGVFAAREVLAKHDENYMPPEAADAFSALTRQVEPADTWRRRSTSASEMIPELGHFALILALGVALVQGTVPLAGAQRGRRDWIALARPAAYLQFVLVALAFVSSRRLRDARLFGSLRRDELQLGTADALSLRRGLGRARRVAAVLGADARVWTVAVARFSRSLPHVFVARVLA